MTFTRGLPPRGHRQGAESGSKREPVEVAKILEGVMRDLAPVVSQGSPKTGDGLTELQEMWMSVVGQEIGRLSRVIRYRGGVLTVEVTSAPLKAELRSFARDQILEDLNAKGLVGIHDVRFR